VTRRSAPKGASATDARQSNDRDQVTPVGECKAAIDFEGRKEARLRCVAARRLANHADAGRLDASLAFPAISKHLERAEQFLEAS
jgi:hypothetical protein